MAVLARRFPRLQVVLDHFPAGPTTSPTPGAAPTWRCNGWQTSRIVATRIDAIGTIFRAWDTDTLRPWLHGVVEAFGAERCMLGSDLPIETLRSRFGDLYAAYDAIFDSYSEDDRRQLFGDTAQHLRRRHASLKELDIHSATSRTLRAAGPRPVSAATE